MTPREAFAARIQNQDFGWREIELLARALNKVVVSDSGCWIWTGMRNRNGYGVCSIPRRANEKKTFRVAHRAVWTLLTGDLLTDMTLDHLCQERACVNPEHLEPCSLEENVSRGWQRERIERRNQNREKKTCPLGHPYDDENTYRRANGARVCRTCIRERQARRRAEEPELVKEIKRRSYRRNAETVKARAREYRAKKKAEGT